MSVVLVEGLDRAGKTTECRRIMALPRNRPRLMLHFVAPPPGARGNVQVLKEMAQAYTLAALHPEIDFVLDRGHVSWYAYHELRGGGVPDVQFDDFERVFPADLVRIVFCEAPAEELLGRDDGASTWTRRTKQTSAREILREQITFDRLVEATRFPVLKPGAL